MSMLSRLILCSLLLLAPFAHAGDTPPPSDDDESDEILPVAQQPDPRLAQYWEAVRLLDSKNSADKAAGRAALEAVAEREFTHAQILLASFHMTGAYGVKEDKRKAANLLMLAAARGSGFARVSLGVCYFHGIGVRRSEKQAAEWLQASLASDSDFEQPRPPAELAATVPSSNVVGDQARDPANISRATAQLLLGVIAATSGNLTAAHSHYLAAANAGPDGRDGLYPAALQAALNYAFGRGVPRDSAKANELLAKARRLSARAGVTVVHNYSTLKAIDEFAVADLEVGAEAEAERQQQWLQMSIAASLADKKSKDYNPTEAARWYEIAAENNQVWAMFSLALLHSTPGTSVHNPAKAFHWLERAGGGDKPKNDFAAVNLAICLQHGLGTSADPERAAKIFQQHRAEHYLAYLGTKGMAPAKICTDEDVVALLKAGVKKKDAHAEYFLGARQLQGVGVEQDQEAGLILLVRAARAGVPEAMLLLGNLSENSRMAGLLKSRSIRESTDARAYYKRASEAGLAEASVSLAYLTGGNLDTPVRCNEAEAYYLLGLAQDPKHPRAHNNLGVIQERRLQLALNSKDEGATAALREKMIGYYEKAAELGFALAALNLGKMHRNGTLVPQDHDRAYREYDRAAELGITEAHYYLGLMHDAGQGVPVTPTEAAYHYRLAALGGHFGSLRKLIEYYLTGQVADVDLDRGAFWVQYVLVRYRNLGLLRVYCDILMQKESYATLIPILKNYTESPDAAIASYAHGKLGTIYRDGLGVKPSPRRARKHHERAMKLITEERLVELAMESFRAKYVPEGVALMRQAAERSSNAKYFLGQMFHFGTNVEKDPAQALQFMHAAAKEGHRDAQYFLAVLTLNGETGAPALEEAIELARQAERGGRAEANSLLQKLEHRRAQAANTPL